jgi:hypothetical protein
MPGALVLQNNVELLNWCWLHFTTTISSKVIVHKSGGEVFLVEQD